MSTQVLGRGERSKLMAALIAPLIAVAVFLLATQAMSIWSSRGVAQLTPSSAQVATITGTHPVNGSQIPAGCWVKYGCHRGASTLGGRSAGGRHLPPGCRVKYGCEPDAGIGVGH